MRINTKGIKAFLQDSIAISPAIATLILIVIAAVAAAGIGIIVQNAQKNAEGQSSNKDLSAIGTFTIKGSTTILPISQNEIQAFSKLYPGITITLGGGGSGTGRALVYNKQVDIGASSDLWPTGQQTDSITGLSYGGRETAVIQGTGPDAFVYETMIGKGLIVLGANLQDDSKSAVKAINIIPGNTSAYDNTGKILNLSYQDLVNGYSGTNTSITLNLTGFTSPITTVQRSDDGGTEEVFNQWLMRTKDSGQLASTVVDAEAGNQGIRDFVAKTTNSIGFMDIGFAAGGVNGNALVIPATMNGTVASKTTAGATGNYAIASKQVDNSGPKSLARDLYYYNQPGVPTDAVKAFLDFVTSPDGQNIVEQSGFYKK